MRLACTLVCFAAALGIWSCANPPAPRGSETAASANSNPPPPHDETQRFPLAGRVDTKLMQSRLLGKNFMPGGTLAHYRKGGREFDMFVARTRSANDAALILPDWRGVLTGSTLAPSFGGYFGMDAGRPVFVFAKGPWIAGIAGLPQREADLEARSLAARLN